MRVLQVIPSLSSVHGGPSRAIALIEAALRDQGIAVETVTTDDEGPGAYNGKGSGSPLREGAAIRRYFPKRLDFYKVSPGFAAWALRNVRDYDLVHIHALFSFTSIVAAWAAGLSGVPYVVRPLGTLNRYGMEQRRPWLKRLSMKILEGPVLRRAAAVHFTAEAERVEASMLGVQMRAVVIPLGVDPAPRGDASMFLARFPDLRDHRVLLFLSRLDPKKNVEGLLRAFAQVVGEVSIGIDDPSVCPKAVALSDTRLVVAGDGDPSYVAELKRMAVDLCVSHRVIWLGHVDADLKPHVHAAAHVFVLPSLSENFGIAAAEALLAGLPCVLGKGVAIAAEVAQAGAGLAVSPDPTEIAHALMRLLRDPALRASMGGRAASLARSNYSLEALGKRLAALYEGVIATHR